MLFLFQRIVPVDWTSDLSKPASRRISKSSLAYPVSVLRYVSVFL